MAVQKDSSRPFESLAPPQRPHWAFNCVRIPTLTLFRYAETKPIPGLKGLGDTRYDPWFEEMNRRGVTLFVHPVPAKASRSVDLGIDVSIVEFMFDTTRMLTNMIFSGAKNRFSKINIISTHGGGTIPYLMTRIETLERVFGPGKGRAHLSPAEIREGLASFYYDLTAATSPAQLFALQQMVPLSHLVMGFDNPFMPGWTFPPAHRICSTGTASATLTFLPSLIRMRSRSIPLSPAACSSLKPPERPNTGFRVPFSRFWGMHLTQVVRRRTST